MNGTGRYGNVRVQSNPARVIRQGTWWTIALRPPTPDIHLSLLSQGSFHAREQNGGGERQGMCISSDTAKGGDRRRQCILSSNLFLGKLSSLFTPASPKNKNKNGEKDIMEEWIPIKGKMNTTTGLILFDEE